MHGPGRGSAVGSLVSFVLGITEINPLEHGLIFERFITPLRDFQPDFDIDFKHERLNEVIEIVKEFHGEQNVARIAVYMSARSKIAISMAAKKYLSKMQFKKESQKMRIFYQETFVNYWIYRGQFRVFKNEPLVDHVIHCA